MREVINKFKFKDTGIVINAPEKIEKELIQLGLKNKLNKTANSNLVFFIHDQLDFLNILTKQLQKIETDCVLWFAYPKGSSKIKTNINRDTLRMTGEEYGITTVAAISIDETWSALRFRPIEKVGK